MYSASVYIALVNVSLAPIQRVGTQYADGINTVLNPGCILNSSGYRTGGASCWMPPRSLVDTTISLIMYEYAVYNEYALYIDTRLELNSHLW